jgi:hypothetical protein
MASILNDLEVDANSILELLFSVGRTTIQWQQEVRQPGLLGWTGYPFSGGLSGSNRVSNGSVVRPRVDAG